MKITASIIFLACIFFTLSGYHLVFRCQLARAKAEMKASLRSQRPHRDLVEFSFSEEELKQLDWENEHEFGFKGEMYDVIGTARKGERLLIRCIPDKKETLLLAFYKKALQRSTVPGPLSSLIKLTTAPFVLPANDQPGCTQNTVQQFWHPFISVLPFSEKTILTPPPEVC